MTVKFSKAFEQPGRTITDTNEVDCGVEGTNSVSAPCYSVQTLLLSCLLSKIICFV
jgi:hypothetical protein